MTRRTPVYAPFPCATLFRSRLVEAGAFEHGVDRLAEGLRDEVADAEDEQERDEPRDEVRDALPRSEEHTSELQSRQYPVCRPLLEKKQPGGSDRQSPSLHST